MDEELLSRQPPQSLEAEQAVLGSILIDSRCVADVIGIVKPNDFFLEQNREIYETIYTMFNFSETIDPVTVLDKMRALGNYHDNSRDYVMQLMEITPTAANAVRYANIVREKSMLRGLGTAATEISSLVHEQVGTPSEILEAAERKIYALRKGENRDSLEHIGTVLYKVFDRLNELAASDSAIPGLSTGLRDLDVKINGLNKSDLLLIAARPAMGKSSLALNIGVNVAKRYKKTVAVFNANIVREKSMLRGLGTAATEISSLVHEQVGTPSEILEAAERKIYALRKGENRDSLEHIGTVLYKVFDRLNELAASDSAIPGLSTGLRDLDVKINGLNKSDLLLIAARPAMGKSSLALNIGVNVAKRYKKTVAVFNLEMSREQLAMRLLSGEAFVDSAKMQTGKLEEEEWTKLAMASAALSQTDIRIDDNPSITVAEMNAMLRRVEDLGLVIIDYLQLMTGSGYGKQSDNRVQIEALRTALAKLDSMLPGSPDEMIDCDAAQPMGILLTMLMRTEGDRAEPLIRKYAECNEANLAYTAHRIMLQRLSLPVPEKDVFHRLYGNNPETMQPIHRRLYECALVDEALRNNDISALSSGVVERVIAAFRDMGLSKYADIVATLLKNGSLTDDRYSIQAAHHSYIEQPPPSPRIIMARYILAHPEQFPTSSTEQP